MYALHLKLVGKPVVDYLCVIIKTFLIFLTVETVQSETCQCWHFSKGVGHFECKFQMEGGVTHQPLLVTDK